VFWTDLISDLLFSGEHCPCSVSPERPRPPLCKRQSSPWDGSANIKFHTQGTRPCSPCPHSPTQPTSPPLRSPSGASSFTAYFLLRGLAHGDHCLSSQLSSGPGPYRWRTAGALVVLAKLKRLSHAVVKLSISSCYKRHEMLFDNLHPHSFHPLHDLPKTPHHGRSRFRPPEVGCHRRRQRILGFEQRKVPRSL